MRYVNKKNEIIFGKDHASGGFCGKYIFALLGDEVLLKNNEKEYKLPIISFNDGELFAKDDQGNEFKVIISPKSYFAFVEAKFDENCFDLFANDKINVDIVDPSRKLIENRLTPMSWVKFAEEVIKEFNENVHVDIHHGTIDLTIDTGMTIVEFRYTDDDYKWEPRETYLEFDWGTMTAKVFPSVDAIKDFLDFVE